MSNGSLIDVDTGLKTGIRESKGVRDLAAVTGNYLVMAGVVNPDTEKPYGLNEHDEVDLLGVDGATAIDIGMRAMAIMGLNTLFGLQLPHQVPDYIAPIEVEVNGGGKVDIYPLAYNAQAIATEWGVDEAMRRLSKTVSFVDRPCPKSLKINDSSEETLQTRLDAFYEKHDNLVKDNLDAVTAMLGELHNIIGADKGLLRYEVSSKTLLALQETGTAQCAVFSTIGAVILSRLGLKPLYALCPEHQYLALKVRDGYCYFDGSLSLGNQVDAYPQTLVDEVSLPVNAPTHNNYANLVDADRPKMAEQHYLEALRINPSNAYAHNNYAVLLKNTGRLEEAEQHYLEALRINPSNFGTQKNYAIYLALRGNIDGALKYFWSAGQENTSELNIKTYVLMQIPIINQRIEEFNQGLDANDPNRRPLLTVPEVYDTIA